MVGDHDEAEDLCQEVFLRTYRSIDGRRLQPNPRAWLYKVSTRIALNSLRQRKRRGGGDRGIDVDSLPSPLRSDPEARERLRRVIGAVSDLPARQRAALLLRRFHGRGYGEIAGSLGCNEAAARANVYQAIKKIRAIVGEE